MRYRSTESPGTDLSAGRAVLLVACIGLSAAATAAPPAVFPAVPAIPAGVAVTPPLPVVIPANPAAPVFAVPFAPGTGPHITFGGVNLPSHGTVLLRDTIDYDNPYYDNPTSMLTVGGWVSGLPPLSNTWSIVVQNVPVNLWADAKGGAQFQADIFYGSGQAIGVPYRPWFDDGRRPLMPVLGELFDDTGALQTRSRMLLYESRYDDDLQATRPAKDLIEGLATQLTSSGLTELDPVHLSTLPHPSPADLDAHIDAATAGSLVQALPDEECLDLGLTHPLVGSAAYNIAYLEALGQYTAHEGLANGIDACAALGPIAAAVCAAAFTVGDLAAICVRTLPLPGDFQVCVDSFELDLQNVDVGPVVQSSLAYLDGADLTSDLVIDDVESDIVGRFGDFDGEEGIRIIYQGAHIACPSVDLTSADYDDQDVEDWATCPDLTLDADDAYPTSPLTFWLSPYQEEVDVYRGAKNQFALTNVVAGGTTGTCTEPDLEDHVLDALEAFETHVADAVGNGWDTSTPTTGQSEMLDALLGPIEVGLAQTARHELVADVEQLETSVADGGWLTYTTDAIQNGPLQGMQPNTFYYRPSEDLKLALDAEPWGHDPTAQPFDVGFAMHTGYLNQVLAAEFATEFFQDIPVQPSWADLGINNAANPSDAAVLDGRALSKVHQAFGALSNQVVTIEVTPTLVPFTTMARDLEPPELPGEFPLLYHIGQLRVSLVSPTATWASWVVDFHDRDTQIRWSTQLDNQLFVNPSDTEWTWTATTWQFPACGWRAYTSGLTCESGATAAMAQLVQPYLEAAAVELLAELPVPQLFDADTEASTTRRASGNVLGWWQEDHVVHFYGAL